MSARGHPSTISADKLKALYKTVSAYEHWIGVRPRRKEFSEPTAAPLVYLPLFQQNPTAYALYRQGLVRYVAEAMGGGGLYEDLLRLVRDAESKGPALMAQFWQQGARVDGRFKGQWRNLLEVERANEVTHAACSLYQMKYEIDWPLVVLQQLLDIALKGKLDAQLTRHRDANGKLKKGQVADAISAQSAAYPNLQSMLRTGYLPKLRNYVGHNEYELVGQTIQSLDGSVTITAEEFMESLLALQQVQNAVLWVTANAGDWPVSLATEGVLSVGYGAMLEVPLLKVYQIAPFHQLQPDADWAGRIRFRVHGEQVRTQVGQTCEQRGKLTPHLVRWLEKVRDSRRLSCIVTPVMPCIHLVDHALKTPWGDYCPCGKPTETIVRAKVLGLK